MKKYTTSEFATYLRTKYPGSYDDLSDDELVRLWLKKYPKQMDKIMESDSTNKNEGTNLSFWVGVIIIGVIVFSLLTNAGSILEMSSNIVEKGFGSEISNSETSSNQDPISNNENVPEESIDEVIPEDSDTEVASGDNNFSEQAPSTQKQICYDCKGTGGCPKCSVPQRVRYKQGESPNDHNEIRKGMIVCPQCGGNLMKFGSDKNTSCYLCKATGWKECPKCNPYGNGNHIGQCQTCKGTGERN